MSVTALFFSGIRIWKRESRLDRDVRKTYENPSIGVLLCKDEDDEVVEYVLSRSMSPAVVADYETKPIPKTLLRQKLHEFLELASGGESDG